MDLQTVVNSLVARVEKLEKKRIYQFDVIPNQIKQRHIDGLIIFRGTLANRPTDGSTEVQAYYAEDQKKLYIWNTTNSAWEYASFT